MALILLVATPNRIHCIKIEKNVQPVSLQVKLSASFYWLPPVPTSDMDGILIKHSMSVPRGKQYLSNCRLSLNLVSF